MLFYQGHLIYLKVATVNERRTKHTPVLCRKCSRLPTASFFCAQMYAFAGFLFLCLFCFILVTLFLPFFSSSALSVLALHSFGNLKQRSLALPLCAQPTSISPLR